MSITASFQSAQKSLQKPGGVSNKPLPKTKQGKKPILYLFRHGETFDNQRRIFSGRRDSKLTPKGIVQAQSLAKKLKGKTIDLGIYSPLHRAKQTLQIVLKKHPKVKIESEPLLLERDYGQLTGTSKLKLNQRHPKLCLKYRRSFDFPPPKGESLKEVKIKRVDPFCAKLVKRMKAKKINVALSCTNNTMRLIRMYFEHLSVKQMLELENPLATDYCAYGR